MKNKKSLYQLRFLIILLILAPLSLGFLGDDKTGTKPSNSQSLYKLGATTVEGGKKGDAYRLNINNINLPLNRKGIIAAVNIPDPVSTVAGAGGKFGGHIFLFSGGFFLSGYANGTLFSNAVASASLVEDYVPGLAGTNGDSRAQIYVVKVTDPPFGTAWQDWKDAVELGADYYNGDGTAGYDPVDKNGNGQWDLDEDKPDILGDETVWTVYWDGVPAATRRYNNVPPLGIEVRQTVFAFASGGAIGNLIFVRYRFKYVGLGGATEPAQLDSVLFGVWADVDLGTATDDLVGSDVGRNAGYTYNSGPDGEYGSTPPCYMIDFFSGPEAFIAGETYVDNNGNSVYDDGIDTPLDTAYSYRGQTIGVKIIPGARNMPIASFIEYINGDPTLNDPDNREAARNYMLGKTRQGADIDPCSFAYGSVVGGVNCATVDPRFWYSGDPVANNGNGEGWINILAADSRQMTNTGPFTLKKNEEKEIVVAYVVGQGSSPKNSITVARAIDDGAQTIFNLNFLAPSPPPAPAVTTQSNEDFIELSWPTDKQFNYSNTTGSWDVQYGGYNVYAFQTFNTSESINGQPNVKLIGRYQVRDSVNNLYYKDGNNGGIFLLYAAAPTENILDSNIYKDPATGRIRYRITQDPFTDGPLVKGKPYYFAVTSYGVNHDALINKSGGAPGSYGDYYLTDQTFVQAVENNKNLLTVLMGEDLYLPPVELIPANKISGASNGIVTYDVVNQPELKDNEYQVSFFKNDATVNYNMFWQLKNLTTGTVLVDSGDYYLYNEPNNVTQTLTEGFITKIEDVVASLGTPIYSPSSSNWFDAFSSASATGVFYVGKDIPDGSDVFGFRNRQSDYISADRLRKVELRFGTSGKAYRYLNNYIGSSNLQRQNAYSFAGAVTAADTVGKGTVGNWNVTDNRANGFVDVPFTAWVVDEKFPGDQRQLAVGFVERRKVTPFAPNGNPDGNWDPSDSLNLSGEVIVIFDATYDATGSQIEYTGGAFNTPGGSVTVWSDLIRSTGGLQPIPPTAIGITDVQKEIFISPWFNALYVVGLQRKDASSFYSNGDKLTIPVDIYPYTSDDVYKFNVVKNILSDDQAKGLFEKVNVYPNPLYGYNPYTAYNNLAADDPFVTFTNLPNEEISIKVYSLSGQLLRTLVKDPNSTTPYLNWNLQNESGLRVASGLYLAIVSSPKYGDKVLKFSIIMPQKQLPRF
jgi:hypothetical protein